MLKLLRKSPPPGASISSSFSSLSSFSSSFSTDNSWSSVRGLLLSRTASVTFPPKRLYSPKYLSTSTKPYASLLEIHPRVAQALHEQKPVVALESTIISHGMPYPANVETALEVEKCVEENGSVPATIALIKGKICIGLETDALELLGKTGNHARKVSRRDFASTLSSPTTLGATTVAGTMIAAHMANIPIFVTGGIGGVHRGAETTFDISADLTELSRTPVAVICAGIKSILDIPKTLEYLETQGVPVVSYNTDEFPAFFSTRSGIRSPERMNSTDDIARMIHISKNILNLSNGCVVAVPNPAPTVGADIDTAINTAIKELEIQKISGKEATPFLLSRIAELTQGNSLQSNVTLIKHNAVIGSKIAVDYSRYVREKTTNETVMKNNSYASTVLHQTPQESGLFSNTSLSSTGKRKFSTSSKSFLRRSSTLSSSVSSSQPSTFDNNIYTQGQPLVIGGAVMDVLCRPLPNKTLELHTSNPGQITYSYGGVGKNIAEVMGRLSQSSASEYSVAPVFITALDSATDTTNNNQSDDKILSHASSPGSSLVNYCRQNNIQIYTVGISSPSSTATATYMAVLDQHGELLTAVADMQIFDQITPSTLEKLFIRKNKSSSTGISFTEFLKTGTSFVICDANLPIDTLRYIGNSLNRSDKNIPFLFEPISTSKCIKILDANVIHLTTVLKPNRYEVIALANEIRKRLRLPAIESLTTTDATNPQHTTMKTVKNNQNQQDKIVNETYTFSQDAYKQSGTTWVRTSANDTTETENSSKSTQTVADKNSTVLGAAVDDANEDEVLNDELLLAAQTVFAAMMRPYGLEVPLSPSALTIAWKGIHTPEGLREVQKVVPKFGTSTSSSTVTGNKQNNNRQESSTTPIVYPAPITGGTIEGRKHLIITLGKYGVLWLSGQPLATSSTELDCLASLKKKMKPNELSSSSSSSSSFTILPSDLLFVLPFFTASNHPSINFDFKLCHPTPIEPTSITKVTGAGDTLVGSLVWSLCEGAGMAPAIQIGMAGASLALQSIPSEGAVPRSLTVATLEERTILTPPIDPDYA